MLGACCASEQALEWWAQLRAQAVQLREKDPDSLTHSHALFTAQSILVCWHALRESQACTGRQASRQARQRQLTSTVWPMWLAIDPLIPMCS